MREWEFVRAIPAHLDAPLNIGPDDFAEAFAFLELVGGWVGWCDVCVCVCVCVCG